MGDMAELYEYWDDHSEYEEEESLEEIKMRYENECPVEGHQRQCQCHKKCDRKEEKQNGN